MTTQHYSTDVTIIGAGPIGLFSIFQLGMLKIKCHVIDSLEEVGGQCRALYPEKPIYDIPAYSSITANQLIKNLEEQSAPFNPTYHLNQTAENIESKDNKFIVTTSSGTTIECKAIIIAAGTGAFGPNRPPLANINEYEGKSAFYMVKSKSTLKDKKIVIAGGGDSAVDWAISLSDVASKIYFIHRRDKFRAAPDSVDKLRYLSSKGKINILTPYQLASINGKNGQIESIDIKDMEGNIKNLEADILLPFFGIKPNLGNIKNWGLDIENSTIKVSPTTMQTNIEGIFAVGDISLYENKLKLILSGFSEAAIAAHSIYPIIFPNESLHFVHSTSKGINK